MGIFSMKTSSSVCIHMSPYFQDPITISPNCTSGQNITSDYELSYTTDSGTLNTTCVVNGMNCSNGICRYELQNATADSSCQPLFSGEGVIVSVTAGNIVGRSSPSVSRIISEFLPCQELSVSFLSFPTI